MCEERRREKEVEVTQEREAGERRRGTSGDPHLMREDTLLITMKMNN